MTDPSNRLSPLHNLPRFASVVAHELRNPLSAVKIALQTLARQGSLSPKDSSRVEIALREVGTIEGLLSQLLDWVRPSDLNVEEVSAGTIAKQAVATCRAKIEEAEVTVCIRGIEQSLLRADRHLLSRALSELVHNAVQASCPGNEVVVELREERTGDVLETEDGDDPTSLVFEVHDNGSGLPEGDPEGLFAPFFSRRAKGFGLGLPRAREYARLHGGDVQLHELSGGGTRAVLTVRRQGPPSLSPASD